MPDELVAPRLPLNVRCSTASNHAGRAGGGQDARRRFGRNGNHAGDTDGAPSLALPLHMKRPDLARG